VRTTLGRWASAALGWLLLTAGSIALLDALPEPPPLEGETAAEARRATSARCVVFGGPECGPGRGVLEGGLGWSRRYQRSVGELLPPRLGVTLSLLAPVLGLSFALALGLGLWSGVRHPHEGRWLHGAMLAGSAMPLHWIGLILLWAWLTGGGQSSWGARWLLPGAAASVYFVSRWARYVRERVLDAMNGPVVRYARVRGLSTATILRAHVLPAALVPLLALSAQSIPVVVSGLVVLETVFSIPGMGRLIYESVLWQDYAVAVLAFSLYAALTFVASLVADAGYRWLDPRIRFEANR
jgi:peptide/nickel transport system permease protein